MLFENLSMSLNLAENPLRILAVGNLGSERNTMFVIERPRENKVDIWYQVTACTNFNTSLRLQWAALGCRVVRSSLVEITIESQEFDPIVSLECLSEGDLKVDRKLPMPIVSVENSGDGLEMAVGIVAGDLSEDLGTGRG